VRFGAWVIIVASCLSLTGCALFGKKTPSPTPATPPAAAPTTASTDAPGTSPFSTTGNTKTAPPPGAAGILAGRVIDSYDHRPPPAIIQVLTAGDKAGDGKAQEVSTDSFGYFTIQGLLPGQHYELVARTKEGEHRLAGRWWGTAPNPRVLIYISEDLVPAASSGSSSSGSKRTNNQGNGAADGRTSSIQGPDSQTAAIGAPVRIPGRESDITPAGNLSTQGADIPLNINGGNRTLADPPAPVTTGLQQLTPGVVPARVPSCVLTGKQLENFALYDLTGQPWEYRTHRGKLVLIDFWGTWCIHCRPALATLKALHNTYARYGLEVVGIAYERPESPAQRVELVRKFREDYQLPYQLLMGGDIETCPVKTQFGVNSFPTLVLLDENNRIIWRSEGLRENDFQVLQQRIREHLLTRRFEPLSSTK